MSAKIKKPLIALLLLVLSSSSYCSITTATSNGDWDEGGLWDNGEPGCFDTIVIPAGLEVEITSTVDLESCADSILIQVYGTLKFQSGRKLKLPCDSDVVVHDGGAIEGGGGGGNSNYIEICNSIYWNAGAGNITGPMTFCDGGCVVLPIELVYFTATLNSERTVDLNWVTASEVDNDYFTVQRSQDGINWFDVFNKTAVGNSSVPIAYQGLDSSPLFGETYYRLKQTDFDQSFAFSPAVRVNNFEVSTVQIYPNPALSGSTIVVNFPKGFKDDVNILVRSADGKLILRKTFEIKDSHQAMVSLPEGMSAGVYSISCEVFSKIIIVQ